MIETAFGVFAAFFLLAVVVAELWDTNDLDW